MTRYFAGNSLAAFSRSASGCVESTTAGRFDSSFVPYAILVPQAQFIRTADFPVAVTTLWFAYEWYFSGASSNGIQKVFFRNSSGVTVARFYWSGATYTFEYWNGSEFVNAGTISALTTGTLHRVTWKIVCGASGSWEMYVAGTLHASGSIASASTDNIQSAQFTAQYSSGEYFSQVQAADYDIRDSRFAVPALNGNSAANTGGTGSYTDVVPPIDDSTSVKVTTAGNKQGQTKAAITVPGGYSIGAMVVSGRGRASGTITDGKLGVRGSGGTNSSGSGLGYNAGYEPRQRIVETDPDTATAFTQSGFNSSEIYEEAV